MNFMSYNSYYMIFLKISAKKITNTSFSSIIVTPMNTSIETNTCMTLISYTLFLDKSEPRTDKAILSSLYTMFLV